MTIPQGYKQTELGIIPEDWEVTTIKQIADITTGNKNTQDAEEGGKYPFYVRSQNVERINSYSYDCEGIVTAGDGVGTGKIFHYVRGKFGLHQRAYLIYNFKDFDSQYFYWYFSQYFYDRINQMTAKSSVDSVRKEMIEDMCILRAPIAEQRAIAEALSDVDGLIAALDKKIAKKRLLKQGAMQQLLTGKKRLPGFTDKWVEKKVKDVFRVTRGYVLATNKVVERPDGYYKYPVFSSQTQNNGVMGYYTDYLFEDAITWTTDGANAGEVNYRQGKFYCTNVCGVLISEEGYANECVASIINMVAKSHVSYIGNPKLMNNVMADIEICIPPSIKEQQAMATILSNMDKEIADLEAQRDKYRLLKSGMMQKLLTGQIRLTTE
jgi:type I restriction enzyme S subunit